MTKNDYKKQANASVSTSNEPHLQWMQMNESTARTESIKKEKKIQSQKCIAQNFVGPRDLAPPTIVSTEQFKV